MHRFHQSVELIKGHHDSIICIPSGNYRIVCIFDNLSSLTTGNLAEADSWLPMVPWIRELTKQKIGQLWINHTGHNKERDYGTSTRLWQMDTAMVAQKIKDSEADIAFRLEFVKARQRKPSNRADYEPVDMILQDDQ